MKTLTVLSPAESCRQHERLHPALLLMGAAFTLLAHASLNAQSLTFAGATPSVNFGCANLCKPGRPSGAVQQDDDAALQGHGRICNVNIQFTALTEGPHTITLTLGSNGASDCTVLLQGTGSK